MDFTVGSSSIFRILRSPSIIGIILASALRLVSAQTPSELNRVASQIPGRDLRINPPKILSMNLFPIPQTKDGNSRLEVQIGESMPSVLQFIWEGSIRRLRDDGLGGDRLANNGIYSVIVLTDISLAMQLTSLVREKPGDAVTRSALGEGGIPIPVFGENIGVAKSGSSLISSPKVQSAFSTSAQAFSANDCFAGIGTCFVDQEKALLIRDLSVVNNSNRTKDPCLSSSASDANKKWTFGYLLTQMANQNLTGKSPSQFALDWLNRWEAQTTVNGESVKANPSVVGTGNNLPKSIRTKWLAASNSTTTLAMNKAPFRLLAIVNRFDLRQNLFFGEGLAGELRFVFGVLDNAAREYTNGPCSSMDKPGQLGGPFTSFIHTVILEYAVDKVDQAGVYAWAQGWIRLNEQTMGSTAYLAALETITESVVRAGIASTARANRSELIRIRTNETGDDVVWDLREFNISSSLHSPVVATIKQTPRASLDKTWNIGKWMLNNRNAILSNTHNLPASFPTGQSYTTPLNCLGAHILNSTDSPTNPHPNSVPGFWDPIGLSYPQDVELRHKFSLNTCVGCHGRETNSGPLFFAHIEPRTYGTMSELSSFLTGVPMGAIDDGNTTVSVQDPIDPNVFRYFDDLADRNSGMNDFLINYRLSALSFQPTSRTH
jgi:hypothetical protein